MLLESIIYLENKEFPRISDYEKITNEILTGG